jgi:hypothetical protein
VINKGCGSLIRGCGILHDFVFVETLAHNKDIRGPHCFNENVATLGTVGGAHGELRGL